jgi:hypothetical protein
MCGIIAAFFQIFLNMCGLIALVVILSYPSCLEREVKYFYGNLFLINRMLLSGSEQF